jgi:hypothetical protein
MNQIQCPHPESHTQRCQIAHSNVPWQNVHDAEESDDAWGHQFWIVDVHGGLACWCLLSSFGVSSFVSFDDSRRYLREEVAYVTAKADSVDRGKIYQHHLQLHSSRVSNGGAVARAATWQRHAMTRAERSGTALDGSSGCDGYLLTNSIR